MPSNPVTSHTAEYNLLFDALPVAIKRACEVLQQFALCSAEYAAADQEMSRILARINELTNEYLRAPNEVISTTPLLGDRPESEHLWER